MANTTQARKRIRQASKRRVHNVALRSKMRALIKSLNSVLSDDNRSFDKAKTIYLKVQGNLDGMSRKGLITKNKAARVKSRLNSKVKNLAPSNSI